MDSIDLVQHRDVPDSSKHGNEMSGSKKGGKFFKWLIIIFPKRILLLELVES
jgi:hypothetical protein